MELVTLANSSSARRPNAAVIYWLVVLRSYLKVGSRRLMRREADRISGLSPREVVVSMPSAAWGAPVRREVEAVVNRLVERAPRRWRVRIVAERSEGTRQRAAEIRRSSLLLECAPGFERDVIAACRPMLWEAGVRRDTFGVRVTPSFRMQPASQTPPPGPITFDDKRLQTWKQRAGVTTGALAAGVEIVVIDIDPPDPGFLPDDIRQNLEVLGGRDPAQNGHGTLVTAVIGAVAPGAKIRACGVANESGSVTWSAIHQAILEHADSDVIVVALTMDDRGIRGDELATRDIGIAEFFRGLACSPIRPVVLFPTGNDWTERTPGLSAPARAEDVLAIGAVDERPGRSVGSRCGEKEGDDPTRWWVCPGGAFTARGTEDSFVSMGDRPQAGTSVAVAFAAGVVALSLGRLRGPFREEETSSTVVTRMLEHRAENSAVARRQVAIIRDFEQIAGGARGRSHLYDALEAMPEVDLFPDYSCEQYGRGLLRVVDEPAR